MLTNVAGILPPKQVTQLCIVHAHTVEKGLALPRGSVPQSDQAQLACLGRNNGPVGTSQSTYIIGTAQQMPLHTSAACANLHNLSLS